jgi:hypothetical protein
MMTDTPTTVAIVGLSNLERLELEEFLKSWDGGGAWRLHAPEVREARSPAQTLGQPDTWMVMFSAASPLIYAIAQWIAAKRRTVTIEIDRTTPKGERVKRTVRVNETTPAFSAEGAKAVEEELTKAIETPPD